jgi:hypothetical protein
VPTLKKNVSSSVRRREDGIFCVSCDEEHDFNDNNPVVVFITDQNFPPSLPSHEHRCVVVLRLEDCLLSEQPGILKEFFGTRSGYLPEGSALYFGSLSHLAMRGLETYAEEVVKSFKVFTNMLPGGCTVAHTVHFPLGGVASESLVRDIFDLDSWLRSGMAGLMLSLPKSRDQFWKIVRRDSDFSPAQGMSERVYFLPESVQNSHKVRTVSGTLNSPLPAMIEPLSENSERELIAVLMREIQENVAVEIDSNPSLDRCSGDIVFDQQLGHNSKIFAIGASHMTRLVGGLAEHGLNVVNLANPGWILTEESATDIRLKLKNCGAGPGDILLIDPLSNSLYCGSDSEGNLTVPVKINGDWHVVGEMNVRPRPYLKIVLQSLKKITDALPDSKLIVLSPMPRYVSTKCCEAADHITNFSEPTYANEISASLERVDELLTAWLQAQPNISILMDYRTGTDEPEAEPRDLMVDGMLVWGADDPVHAAAPLYWKLAEAIATALEDMGPAVSGLPKRPRLESLVVRPVSRGSAATKPVAPQSWSAGILRQNPQRGGGSGRRGWPRNRRGWGRGGRFWRGTGVRGRGAFWAPKKM